MRNNDVNDETKMRSLKLLEETANELKKPNMTEQRLARTEQELQMCRYAITNILKVLNDMPAIKAQIDQLDYRTLGIMGAVQNGMDQPRFDDMVEQEAKKSREASFWELSNKDDEDKKLVVANLVDESSTIIFTTECAEEPDQGVFRSKMDVASDEFKDYKDSFIGKQVDDKVDITIRGKVHTATILGVRNKGQ